MHVSFIREATRTENSAVSKTKELRLKNDNTKAKLSVLSYQKKELDKRFNKLSKRVTSFSSTCDDVHAKHIRFASSSSEAEESDDVKSEDGSSPKLSLHRAGASDRIGNCPYPSATEEMTRLGRKDEVDISLSGADCSVKSNINSSSKKKRKLGSKSGDLSNPSKLVKRDEICSGASKTRRSFISTEDFDTDDHSANNSSIMAFITTWKEACHTQTAAEVSCHLLSLYDWCSVNLFCYWLMYFLYLK